ncbi:MAG: hypothetical protein AAF436_20355 [Myxococcota bacterium]
MNRRYREPVFLAFVIALIASLSLHLPVYEVLGKLADHLRELAEEERKNAPEPVEVEFDVPDQVTAEAPTRKKRQNAKRRARPQQKRAQRAAQPQPTPEQKQQQAPPEEPLNRQAVQQRSQNPDVEPPPDARFVAQENQRVEEETVAKVRNYIRDDEQPEVGRQQKPSDTLQEEGNSQDDKIADARDKEGSDARTVTEDEAKRDRPDRAIDADPIKSERVASQSPDGKRSNTAGDRAGQQGEQTITITDGAGTFTVSRPSRAGQGGGQRATGRGPGSQLTWSKFEAAVGSDKLREDRRARIAEHKSSHRGVSREKSWNQFRAAIENFTPAVKPGTQTALNAAASPFANYIAAVHRRIHREFADRFLRNLPMFAGSPYSDPTLMTKLEIVLNQDGSVHRVGVAKSSGLLPFDFGAFNSVLRGQPYPPAPKSILSGDGRAYLHWGFYKNHRQCGTFNAEPYILPNPPGTPARRDGLTDGPDWNTVVPAGAQPTWRTRDEPSDSEAPDEEQQPRQNQSPPAQPKEDDTPRVPPAPPGSSVG